MRYSRTISLFSERPELSQRPSSFVVSIIAHAVGIVLLSFGIIYTPEYNDRIVPKRYSVRHLDLHTPKTQPRQPGGKGIHYPGTHTDAVVHKPAPVKKPAAQPGMLRQTADADKGKQTLIQPDLSEPVTLAEEAPVPDVTIWSPKKELVKVVVAPLPEKATAADVKPSIHTPNQEIDLADLGVSSSKTPTMSIPVFPATTSPVVVHGPNKAQLPPVTATQKVALPTPTAVMSISDLTMPDGTATLPPVNVTTVRNESSVMAPGEAAAGSQSKEAGEQNGIAGAGNGTTEGAGSGLGAGEGMTTEHFVLPKNGQFPAVVVGASLEESFPELTDIWHDRVAYTVYLHVGLQKSWVLQYSLPRTTEAEDDGNVSRLEAPWPYNIVRPNLSADAINSDAVLVHGYVNRAGKFESLGVAFPPEFQQAQFVLDSLNQWQFRPAVRNGQIERVEVLLIIPEERDQ
jgi:hypothetical protein